MAPVHIGLELVGQGGEHRLVEQGQALRHLGLLHQRPALEEDAEGDQRVVVVAAAEVLHPPGRRDGGVEVAAHERRRSAGRAGSRARRPPGGRPASRSARRSQPALGPPRRRSRVLTASRNAVREAAGAVVAVAVGAGRPRCSARWTPDIRPSHHGASPRPSRSAAARSSMRRRRRRPPASPGARPRSWPLPPRRRLRCRHSPSARNCGTAQACAQFDPRRGGQRMGTPPEVAVTRIDDS